MSKIRVQMILVVFALVVVVLVMQKDASADEKDASISPAQSIFYIDGQEYSEGEGLDRLSYRGDHILMEYYNDKDDPNSAYVMVFPYTGELTLNRTPRPQLGWVFRIPNSPEGRSTFAAWQQITPQDVDARQLEPVIGFAVPKEIIGSEVELLYRRYLIDQARSIINAPEAIAGGGIIITGVIVLAEILFGPTRTAQAPTSVRSGTGEVSAPELHFPLNVIVNSPVAKRASDTKRSLETTPGLYRNFQIEYDIRLKYCAHTVLLACVNGRGGRLSGLMFSVVVDVELYLTFEKLNLKTKTWEYQRMFIGSIANQKTWLGPFQAPGYCGYAGPNPQMIATPFEWKEIIKTGPTTAPSRRRQPTGPIITKDPNR